MFLNLKRRLRERILGGRFRQMIHADNLAISRLGNSQYLARDLQLLAPGHRQAFNAHEFSYYSQNGEDGLILYLLSLTGADSHFMVEIGTEDGRECNSANLILNFGWQACLIEAAAHWSDEAVRYFSACGAGDRVQILNTAASPENINELLHGNGVPVNTDVLSIDIDGYDYWVWQAVDAINPAIVVIEYNASFGPSRSVTIPYPAMAIGGENRFYHGASITALHRLGGHKGYVLVGTDGRGVNAFFVRRDLLSKTGLAAADPGQVYTPHFRRTRKRTPERQYQAIAHLPLTEIE